MANKLFTDDFKETILGLLVQNQQFLKEIIPILKPEMMENNLYNVTVDSIFRIYRITGSAPSRAGLLNEIVNELLKIAKLEKRENALVLKPAEELISRIYKPIDAPLEDVKAAFIEYCRTKEMQGTIVGIYSKLASGEMDYQRVMAEVRQAYLKCNQTQDKGIEFYNDSDNILKDLLEAKNRRFTTGIPSIDNCMDGGPTGGTLTTIIGAAKGGKSMFLVNAVKHNVILNYNVFVATLEISDKKWRNRIASNISGVKLKDMVKDHTTVIEQIKRHKRLHTGSIYVKFYPSATVDNLRSYMYYLEGTTGKKIDVVVVDYGDLLRASTKVTDERFIQRDAYTDLRSLASEFDCAVFTASQCNRQAVDKPVVKMKDIAESFSKVQISDHILTLCQTDEEVITKNFRVFFAGSREAETGKFVKMRYDWERCWMEEIHKNDEGEKNIPF